MPGHPSCHLCSVLPNFEVKITPWKPYILTVPSGHDEIQLDIQARYLPAPTPTPVFAKPSFLPPLAFLFLPLSFEVFLRQSLIPTVHSLCSPVWP